MAVQCPYEGCKHIWEPRVLNPKACPKCKRHFNSQHQLQKVDVEVASQRITKLQELEPITQSTAALTWCINHQDAMTTGEKLAMYMHKGQALCLECLIEALRAERQITLEEVLNRSKN